MSRYFIAILLLVFVASSNAKFLSPIKTLRFRASVEEIEDALFGAFDGMNFFKYVPREDVQKCVVIDGKLKSIIEGFIEEIASISSVREFVAKAETIFQDGVFIYALIKEQVIANCIGTVEQSIQYLEKMGEIVTADQYFNRVLGRLIPKVLTIQAIIAEITKKIDSGDLAGAGYKIGFEVRDTFFPGL